MSLKKQRVQEKELFSVLDEWIAQGWIRPLDRAFVCFLHELEPQAPGLVLLAAALTSHQLGRGHVCLDLKETLDRPEEALSIPPEGKHGEFTATRPSTFFENITVASWEKFLSQSSLVATGPGNTPLVLDAGRLYLRRFWQYTQDVSNAIGQRLLKPLPTPADLSARLDRQFASLRTGNEQKKTEVHWQSVAAAMAVKSLFSIISGGPGTGKTTTVVHLLALLQELALESGEKLRIFLAAPTGKAAARLTESIGMAVDQLPESLKKAIPVDVVTLHRLLGSRPDTRHFTHHRQNPLHADLLVVDEASMVDLEMMAGVLAALPPDARLIVLGDKDQLASVEAGSVLGDLCRSWNPCGHPPEKAAWIEKNTGYSVPVEKSDATPLGSQITVLQKSHRFGDKSGIGALARAVNAGDPAKVADVWDKEFDDIVRLELTDDDDRRFSKLVLGGKENTGGSIGYRTYLERLQEGHPGAIEEDRWLHGILSDFGRFRLLSPVRKGHWGVETLNERTAKAFFRQNLITGTEGWYPGRPVMITRNDYSLGLMNGDTGILLPTANKTKPKETILKVVFPLPDGSLKKVLPSRLSQVETVFAMTVHKSQGSEFDHTVLAFPDRMSPLLTRELIYTAITRSRTRFTLVGPQVDLMAACVTRQVYRASGLGDLFITMSKKKYHCYKKFI